MPRIIKKHRKRRNKDVKNQESPGSTSSNKRKRKWSDFGSEDKHMKSHSLEIDTDFKIEMPKLSSPPKKKAKKKEVSADDSEDSLLSLPSSSPPSFLCNNNASMFSQNSGASSVRHSSQSNPLGIEKSRKLMPAKRFPTLMGKQGEHVSAYVLYEELILSILQQTNAKKALDSLQKGLKCIASEFDETQKNRLKDLHKKFFNVANNNITRKKRQLAKDALTFYMKSEEFKHKATDYGMNNEDSIIETEIKKFDDALLDSNKSKLLLVVDEILQVVLQATNKMPYVCFPKQGGAQTPSRDEKILKNDLRALDNWLLNLYDDGDHNDSAINSSGIVDDKSKLKKREIRRGYGYAGYSFAEKLNNPGEKGKHGKKSSSSSNSQKNKINYIIPNNQQQKTFMEEIADKIQLLFWYPFIPNKSLITQKKWEEKAGQHGYNKFTVFRTNDLGILYYVAARHIVLIFNCYKGLTYLPKEMQEAIVDNFLRYILKNPGKKQNGDYGQKWSEHSELSNFNDLEEQLSQLKEGIAKYAKLNYGGREFEMYDYAGSENNTEADISNISGFSEEESYSSGFLPQP